MVFRLTLLLSAVCGMACGQVASQPSIPLPVETWAGKTVMFIYAHIDDMEAASGGLVTRLHDIGATVHLLIMTNGDKGCSNDEICGNVSNSELVEIRKQEQYRSAEVLRIPLNNIYFLEYEDVILKTYSRSEISQKIVTLIRSVKPDVVMTWDPAPHFNMIPSEGWGDLGYHPDHQYSGELTVDAVWYASLDRLWPDLGEKWKVPETYTWAYNPEVVPSHYFDINGSPLLAKTEAFLQMRSQYSDPMQIKAMFLMLGLRMGQTCELPEKAVAEGYQYVLW